MLVFLSFLAVFVPKAGGGRFVTTPFHAWLEERRAVILGVSSTAAVQHKHCKTRGSR